MVEAYLKRNIANYLSYFRAILTFLIFIITTKLLNEGKYYNIYLTLYCLAWLSDILDGWIARRLGIESTLGAFVDVTVDFLFVFLLNIQLVFMKILPPFFIVVICEKIVNYVITSMLLSKADNEDFYFWNDYIGRYVVASFFIVPYIAGSFQYYNQGKSIVLIFIIVLLSILGCTSSCIRYINTYQYVKKKRYSKDNNANIIIDRKKRIL